MKILRYLIVVSLFAMCFTGLSSGQQNLRGPLSGNLGLGIYNVVGDIVVLNGQTLTLAPGTVFIFGTNHDFTIAGTIIALGTETDSVKFVQNPDSLAGFGSGWNGFDFLNVASDSSRFRYCVIEGSDCIGFDLDNCSPLIRNCLISNNRSSGG